MAVVLRIVQLLMAVTTVIATKSSQADEEEKGERTRTPRAAEGASAALAMELAAQETPAAQ